VRIAVSLGSEVIGVVRTPATVVQDACEVEAAGFTSGWMVHMSRGVDALSVLAVAATRTTRLELGVGVVPTYPRHPHALAQQAATVQALSGGRLTLGVGVSHRPVIEGLLGLPYAHPADHLRDYLSVLVPLLRQGSVTHHGRYYAVDGGFTAPGTSPVSADLQKLSDALSSGDINSAKTAFAQLQQDFKAARGGHHHHHAEPPASPATTASGSSSSGTDSDGDNDGSTGKSVNLQA